MHIIPTSSFKPARQENILVGVQERVDKSKV
uniref:Uncharacterized protein n=1 Tax=Anguilla anguilla TaxID=7936 RepID=A0A0E9VN68_ANGAN